MAKIGLSQEQFSHQLRGLCQRDGWALCVGAGTSLPLFPSWKELVRRLMRRESSDRNEEATNILLTGLTRQFGLDALIQAARDRFGSAQAEFAELLGEILFSDVQAEFSGEWKLFARAFSAAAPGDLLKIQWEQFLRKIRNYNEKAISSGSQPVSALGIAEAVMDAVENDQAPAGILSFNAESLLYALVNAIAAERHKPEPTAKDTERYRSKVVDRVTRVVSYREQGRIPYFFCHGVLPFPGASVRFLRDTDMGKLVFTESEYLALANTSFAWQSSSFIDTALFRHIVFIGVSLSDPNMRRWLAWVHAARSKELEEFAEHGPSTAHYWLTKRKSTTAETRWIESCVAHLGVRLVWLDEWNEAGNCLRAALA